MASRSVVFLEVRPSLVGSVRSPSTCCRTYDSLHDCAATRTGRRSVPWSPSSFRVHASTDSAESELASEPAVVEDAENPDPEPTTEPTVPQMPARTKLDQLSVGDVRDAVVSSYVNAASECVSVGDKVKVELIEVGKRLKGSLKNHNELGGSVAPRKGPRQPRKGGSPRKPAVSYSPEDEYEGLVDRVSAGGAFVKFDAGKGLGFLPVEEITKTEEMDSPETRAFDILKVGDVISVRVLPTRRDSRRLTLTMRTFEELEDERKSRDEGFRFDDDGESTPILSAALKKAGLVREMFADAKEETLKKIQPVKEVKAVAETPKQIEQETAEQEKTVLAEEPQPEAAAEEPEPEAAAEEPEPEAAAVEEPETEPEVVAEEEPEPDVVAEIEEEEPIVSEAETAEIPSPEVEAVEEAKPEPSIREEIPEPAAAVEKETPVEQPVPTDEKKSASVAMIRASMVKELSDASGAGMMDCKKALKECNADVEAAMDYLKQKGIASAAKRAGKVATEGLIASYIHTGAKLGILVEVNSETDFVARTEAFTQFVDDVALTIAASPDAICISPDDYPTDILEKEKAVEMGKEDLQSKPEAIREKIVMGRLEKTKKMGAVLEQPFIQDQTKTVQAQLTELSAGLGEKISIRRFVRYELGEGLEKRSTDFASEVADQIESKKAEVTSKPEPVSAPSEDQPVVKVPTALVKELRLMTGGGLMDCKNALAECDCELERAAEYLRQKGLSGAAKKSSRLASEGVICSYIHLGSKLGIMAEINCETDFVSRGEAFQLLADDVAMQLAACPDVEYISADDIPAEALAAELQSELQKEDLQSKPEAIREKIAQGRVDKTMKSRCLLDQPCLKDGDKSVGDLVKEHIATLGENIKIRRFVRFNLGEGIEKTSSNFADEVAEQVNRAS